MNLEQNRYKRLLQHVTAGFVAALLALGAHAKDTDVYLMAPMVARDDAPNVLIILDNSGSMDTTIVTPPDYDPTVDYCTDDLDTLTGISGANAGKPADCASIASRIYWKFTRGAPSLTSTEWFDADKNHCEASKGPLTTGKGGMYASSKIAGFIRSSSKYLWGSLKGKTNADITYVDCEADGNKVDGYPKSGSSANNNLSSAYTSSNNNRFNWGNFRQDADPTLYSGNYLNYVHNPNLQVYKTRMDVAKGAVKAIIDSNPGVRFGLMVFNNNNQTPHGGRVIMRVDTMDDTRRATMKSIVDGLSPDTFTPLTETLWEAYRYFAGQNVTYGNPSGESPKQDSCAQNMSNEACTSGGVYYGSSSYNTGKYISPFKYGCQTAYIIYVTDGDPTNDTHADNSIASLIKKPCDGTSCLDDLAGYMHNNDVYADLPGAQVVNTFTIGFGTGISSAGKALLDEAAKEGGGKYFDAENATDLSSALQGALTEIAQVNSSFAAPSLSINAFNKLYNRDDVYFALFKPANSQRWDGNLKRFRLCNSADVQAHGCEFGDIIDSKNKKAIDLQTSKILSSAVSYWDNIPDGAEVSLGGAGAKITEDSAVPRKLYTYRGSYSGLSATNAATPVQIEATSGNAVYQAAIADPTILGLPSSASATDVQKLINWMRGQDAYDEDKDGNVTEARDWNFADPLHSRPVAFTFGAEPDAQGNPDPEKPIIKLFIGTNDGYVRIINNQTGEEEWAFVPNELLNQQHALQQNADGDHIHGMDDSPAFLVNDINRDGIIDPSAGDRVYMYVGMRRGGRNIYAFDVTPSTKMTSQDDKITPKLIWVIRGGTGDYTRLGQTWSRPKVARIRAKCTGSACKDLDDTTDDSESRMVLIFGGGYDIIQDNSIPAGPDSMGNAIYIADPFTGERIWWMSSDSNATLVKPQMEYSIPSEIMAVDTDGDNSIDRLYVGDTGGQLWRIDLGDQIAKNSNGGTDAYVFADVSQGCSTTGRQNCRKFFYAPDVAQVKDPNYSEAPLYDLVTIASGDREDPLDLLTTGLDPIEEAVHNRIYAFRDYNYATGKPASTPSPITEALLYDASDNLLGTLAGAALQAEIDNNVKDKKGWYIDLKEPQSVTLTNGLTTRWVGEKGLAKTVIFAGVLYVSTFVPANDATAMTTCQANEGEGRVYALNYLTGTPVFDHDGDGDLDRYHSVGGGIPSEVIVVIRDGGATALVGTSGGAAKTQVHGGTHRYKTFWYDK